MNQCPWVGTLYYDASSLVRAVALLQEGTLVDDRNLMTFVSQASKPPLESLDENHLEYPKSFLLDLDLDLNLGSGLEPGLSVVLSLRLLVRLL